MEEKDEKYCSNCKRNIASGNFLMHSVHCQRNIKLCSRCNEPVPHSEMKDHISHFHSKMSCSRCGQLMEQWKLEEHEVHSCPKRIVSCHYCELECPHDTLDEHVSYCGSRTEICPLCQNYVMIKNRTEHDESKCKAKQKQFQEVEDLKADVLTSGAPNNRALRRVSWEKNERRNEFKTNAPKRNLSDNPNSCLNRANNNSSEARQSNGSLLHENVVPDAALNTSENLDDLLALQLSSEETNLDEFISEYTPWLPHGYFSPILPYNLIDENSDEFIIPVQNAEDDFNNGDSVCLPCEFCEELFPEDVLILHQSGCELNIQEALPSDAKYPSNEVKSIVKNDLPSSPPANRRSQKHQAEPPIDLVDKLIDKQNKSKNNSLNKHALTPPPNSVGNKSFIKDTVFKPSTKVSERSYKSRTPKPLPNSCSWTSESTNSFSRPLKSDPQFYKKYPFKDYSTERTRKVSGRPAEESSNKLFYQYLDEMKNINSNCSDLKRKTRTTVSGARPKQDLSYRTPSYSSSCDHRSNQGLKNDLDSKSNWKPKSTYQREDRSTRSRVGNRSEVSDLELTAKPVTLMSRNSKLDYKDKAIRK